MGRLTRNPEVRYGAGENSTAVARYTIAVERRFKRDGEQSADFIGCVAFGRNAEFAEKFAGRYFSTPKKMGAQTAEANINAGIAAAQQIVGFLKDGCEKFRVNK